jgi:hypothetical protein
MLISPAVIHKIAVAEFSAQKVRIKVFIKFGEVWIYPEKELSVFACTSA